MDRGLVPGKQVIEISEPRTGRYHDLLMYMALRSWGWKEKQAA